MSDDNAKKRLGRGLAALIGEMDTPLDAENSVTKMPDRMMPIEFIRQNPNNPRRQFSELDLQDLANSIKQHGIVQPIVVRTVGLDKYEIIAGERRWRAGQLAGLNEVPVMVRDVDDRTALEIAIVENVQRSDLNPIEEAMGYQQLITEYSYTQNNLGEVIGKSRSHVANILRLLKLPEKVLGMIASGELSAGHARAIIATSDPEELAEIIVNKNLSVRDAEKLGQGEAVFGVNMPKTARKDEKDADLQALEKSLSDNLGLKVAVEHKNKGGELKIKYKTLEQLDELCRILGGTQ